MNDQRRRFKPRPQRNGYRGRNNNRSSNNGHFQSNGNGNIGRNKNSMTNPFSVEKIIQKFQQLAKDALSLGDPVLHENYLQHAEHYNRRLTELNSKNRDQKSINQMTNQKNDTTVVEKKDIDLSIQDKK